MGSYTNIEERIKHLEYLREQLYKMWYPNIIDFKPEIFKDIIK